MNKIIILCFYFLYVTNAYGQFDQTSNGFHCKIDAKFKAPKQNIRIGNGGHVDVVFEQKNVKNTSVSKIKTCKLYLNNQLIDIKQKPPFSWKATNYSKLRNLKSGYYRLKAEYTLYNCSSIYYEHCEFNVEKGDENIQLCYRLNPTTELQWLKIEIRSNPKILIQEYRKGNDRFFRLRSCHRHHIENVEWYDCRGNSLGNHQPSGSQKYRQWYNGCS